MVILRGFFSQKKIPLYTLNQLQLLLSKYYYLLI